MQKFCSMCPISLEPQIMNIGNRMNISIANVSLLSQLCQVESYHSSKITDIHFK